jgi:hypothetical protein
MKRIVIGIVFLFITVGLSTAAWAQNVHTVTSQSPLRLTDGLTGVSYSSTALIGDCTVSWKDATRFGFFNAKVRTTTDFYEFQMTAISNCSPTRIEGLFDIYKGGLLVANGIVGEVYNVSLPAGVGNYFKFNGGDSQCNTQIWHFSYYIDYRKDF